MTCLDCQFFDGKYCLYFEEYEEQKPIKVRFNEPNGDCEYFVPNEENEDESNTCN